MKAQKRRPLAAALRILGTFLLVLVVAACLPLTAPRLLGYQIYSVISGSMEPAIPTGSLVYIRGCEPAFYGTGEGGAIITHRVLENRVLMGEFVTKGDANPQEDLTPVPYARCIGRAAYSVPHAGVLAEFLTGPKGKLAAGGIILGAVVLQILASVLDRQRHRS